MKKLLFSAVALVAFSSVSMGNTIEVEGSVINRLEKNEITEVAPPNPCKNNFTVALSQAYQQGFSDSQAWASASVAYILCQNGVVPVIW